MITLTKVIVPVTMLFFLLLLISVKTTKVKVTKQTIK